MSAVYFWNGESRRHTGSRLKKENAIHGLARQSPWGGVTAGPTRPGTPLDYGRTIPGGGGYTLLLDYLVLRFEL